MAASLQPGVAEGVNASQGRNLWLANLPWVHILLSMWGQEPSLDGLNCLGFETLSLL